MRQTNLNDGVDPREERDSRSKVRGEREFSEAKGVPSGDMTQTRGRRNPLASIADEARALRSMKHSSRPILLPLAILAIIDLSFLVHTEQFLTVRETTVYTEGTTFQTSSDSTVLRACT